MTPDYEHKPTTQSIAIKIGAAIVAFLLLVFGILALSGCAGNDAEMSLKGRYHSCIAAGGTEEDCMLSATNYSMNNPTYWGK